MAGELDELSDKQCVAVLRAVARRWLNESGFEAFASYQALGGRAREKKLKMPAWLDAPVNGAPPALAKTSRAALQAIAEGSNDRARVWLEKEVAKVKGARGQIFDPLTLSIVGATLIGCILAARVKKIGSVKFYKGIDPELAKVIKAAGSAMPKIGGSDEDDD